MATCKLDGQDVIVEYRTGGVQDCNPTWSSYAPLSNLVSGTLTDLLVSFRINEQTETRNTQGIKAKRRATRVIRGFDTLNGVIHAPAASGRVFKGLRGYYVGFRFTFVDTLDVATYDGVMTSCETDISDATLTETFTVESDAE